MNIARPLNFTFKGHLQNIYYTNDAIDEQHIKGLMSRFEQMSMAMNNITPLLFVIDYTKSQYLVMTDSCRIITGHHPQQLLEGGMPFLIDIYQKDDFRIYNENVFTANANFLKLQPQSEHHKFVFSYNFRVRNSEEKYIPIFQRGSYITSRETGLPLYSLGMVTDISPFKKDRQIYHSIEKIEESNGIITKQIIDENYFFPYAEDKLLSHHERDILCYMADGLSSKQIASRFNISENTVANHRKNMLKKTNTKNVAELVSFACKTQLI
ncbi:MULTISPECIES: response regulator transcription factor [Pedobacter]|uniref:Regulatory protein LuxR n=1 Tax=Pedobacter heparinus (strain ATCC 13125 / DSM 2366 / CIP 104194 / JCM 7457 / NBRC 12017 / NCIMB 9290 / NRRL B-14731 / HIM 762-3) TaxID=485917 RepID=C6Y3I6_PEDHD|nr:MULTISPECIES: helix-turn-helix transcriptional regulator [Pedobacter]ACU03265.1 regulatory protein LuxR [Pedobacter heparinus DSM 2366]MBB5440968.1 DNA-binding CsgD family transcriptional regulator [Pedobacter sp. AK017]